MSGLYFYPQLYLDKGAVLEAKVGEYLSIPFVLKNSSSSNRFLSILNVLKDEQGVKNESIPLTWEKLEPGQERTFSVDTRLLSGGGIHSLRLKIILASCFEGIEEHYVFFGEIKIDVEGEGGQTQIVQHIDLSGAEFGTGGMVVAKPDIHQSQRTKRQAQALAKREEVPLQRAERYELQNGHRGYEKWGVRVPRNVEFVYTGFPSADKPPDGPLSGQLPILRCGRNSRRYDAARNPQPNDLCLRVYDTESGNLDKKASLAISGHQCDFLLQNDRLYLRPGGRNGLTHNDDILVASDDIKMVNHGDSFSILAGRHEKLTFSARFEFSTGLITQICFERSADARNPK